MLYFNHDTGASADDKIMKLRLLHGGAAVDAYWYIVERIYKDETELVLLENPDETKLVSFWLGVGSETLTQWVESMISIGLLTNENGLTSERISENIRAYQSRIETARENGKKGGRPKKQQVRGSKNQTKTQTKPNPNRTLTQAYPNPNPSLTQPKANKIKENKIKGIGFDKQNQIPSASDSPAESGADESAPTSPHCKKCGSLVYFKPTQNVYECYTHGAISKDEVEFK